MERRKTLLTAAVALAFAQGQTPTSVWDGIYSREQAGRGQTIYMQECASCHGEKLEGRGQAPSLTGGEFVMEWNGMTVGDLFEKMQTSMPADKPGKLTREQNANVLAYILSGNKFPPGAADLSSDPERLRQIRFEAARRSGERQQ
jgi:mono/diheme cytochrome c family protein